MSGQSGTGLAATIDDVRLRPFLPLIYVAWSEGEFSADEATGICEVVAGYTGIDLDCKKALEQWLDVEYPPTPDELESLRIRIAGWAEGLDLARDLSVSELGIAIATSTRQETDVTNDESEALNEIQNRYGPLGPVPSALGSLIRLRTIARREAPFDVSKMSEILDGRHKDIRNKVREILSRPQFTYVDGITGDDYREWVLDRIRVLADEGLGVLSYPTPYGPADVGTFVAAFATLGHHDLSVMTKFGVQFGLFGGAIARLGTKRHHDAYLSAAGSLEIPGCFAMTETGHGSNVRDLETVATFDKTRDEFIVNTPHDLARKDYIGNAAAHGQLAVVFARLVVGDTDHGVHAVVVPIRDQAGTVLPGVTIEDNASKGGLNGVDNGRIWFENVRVPRANLLDRFATVDEAGVYSSDIPNPDRRFFTMIGTLVGGRVSVGAAAVSVAKSALTIAVRYSHRRRQFGPARGVEALLIDYPIHQEKLIPHLAATYAYHFAFEQLIDAYSDSDTPQRGLETEAAGLKAQATWHAIETIQAAREATGGQGYLTVNRLTTMRSDADIFTTYEGDNTVLLQLVAKALLTEFRQQFEAMNMNGAARYIFHRVSSAITEASPVTVSTTDSDEIETFRWQLDQLAWRESHLVESLAKRIKKRIEAGIDPVEAFSEVQTHAAEAATSHVDRITIEAFAKVIDRLDSGAERQSLDSLRALHGLSTIRAQLGWYQEHGRFSRGTSREIRESQERLVGEVAFESLALVDAFAIPEQVLGAPIAAYQTIGKDDEQ